MNETVFSILSHKDVRLLNLLIHNASAKIYYELSKEKVSNSVLTFKRILRVWRTWKLKSFMWKSGPASCKLQVAHFISYGRISSLLLLQFYTRIYEHVRWKWIVSQLLRKLLYPCAFLGWILTRL